MQIADIAASGLEFPFCRHRHEEILYNIKDHADTAQRFVHAYTETIAIYKNNRDLAIRRRANEPASKNRRFFPQR
jgi:hypothetical protein